MNDCGWVFNYVDNGTLLAKAKHIFGDDLVVNAFLVIEYPGDTSADEVAERVNNCVKNFEICNAASGDDKLWFDTYNVRIVFASGSVVDFIGDEFAHVERV